MAGETDQAKQAELAQKAEQAKQVEKVSVGAEAGASAGAIAETELKARIFDIQKYSIFDGPGIRTTVFFKGCPLRCKWCANPEGISSDFEIFYSEELCQSCGRCGELREYLSGRAHNTGDAQLTQKQLAQKQLAQKQLAQKLNPADAENPCLNKALKVAGRELSVPEILEIILEDKAFYETSGGGVTFGGGECTSQPEALLGLLKACKAEGIHTALETSGLASSETIRVLAPYVDLFLFDIKHMDAAAHREWTGISNEAILSNLKYLLSEGFFVKVRMPLINGANTDDAEIKAVLDFLEPFKGQFNFLGVDLLPYHKLGVHKYEQLGKEYPLERDGLASQAPVASALLEKLQQQFLKAGIEASIIRH